MDSRPLLNADVLFQVIAVSSLQDAARFIRTSRFFYSEGPKILLRRSIALTSPTEISPFLTFLSAQDRIRFQFLRSLHLDFSSALPSNNPSSSLSQLADAFPLMTHLRSLSLVFDKGHVMSTLVSSISSLREYTTTFPPLRSLQLLEPGPSDECFRTLAPVLLIASNLDSFQLSVQSQGQLFRLLALLNVQPDRRLFTTIRSLSLLMPTLNTQASSDLVSALPYMTNLSSLQLTNSEELLGCHPGLAVAFAALTSIRELRMGAVGELGLNMLKSFKSLLVHVSLNFLRSFEEDETYEEGFFEQLDENQWPQYHPLKLLSRVAPTLEELDGHHWYTAADTTPDPVSVYPNMRKLSLRNASFPRVMPYIRAYPNLTSLVYHMDDPGCTVDHPVDFDAIGHYGSQRRLNESEQTSAGLTWERLETFEGGLLDLYILGLTCRIDCLVLDPFHPDLTYQFLPVMLLACPRRLTLNDLPGQLCGARGDAFAAFRGAGGSRLESLTIKAEVPDGNGYLDVAASLEELLLSLSHSTLREFNLTIKFVASNPRQPDQSQLHRSTNVPLRFAERLAEKFDLETYTRRFLHALPTVQHLHIALSGPRGRFRDAVMENGEFDFTDIRTYSLPR
ncbi:hypothetical protein C8Q79DRAFT_455993 [Trametes meyenii]|nr:hypothetical protein C8Q79DRAFT_455993 [Trametes meyenii]